MMQDNKSLIFKHGGYRKLKTFQIAQLVFDVTVRFCERYIERRSRTCDQMVQAARSGVQNIGEGSFASGTSKKTELKLTSVARSSLEELKLDYEDFLRQRGLSAWDRADPRRSWLIDCRCKNVDEVAQWIKHVHDTSAPKSTFPEIAANAALILLAVVCPLLDRQIAAQARDFKNNGGFSERLYKTRTTSKTRQKPYNTD